MCSVFEVSKKICEARGWSVSNLELQKLLYIAQVLYLGTHNGASLFKANFEAWDYGPVIPEVYHSFKMFGDKPIQSWAFPSYKRECDKEKRNFVEKVAISLSTLKPSQLVSITHREGSAWFNDYRPGVKGIIISQSDMLNEFEKIWTRKNASK